MHIFYTTLIQNDHAVLDAAESHHCVKVLRLTNGDSVQVIDGKGGFYDAIIEKADHRQCLLKLTGIRKDFEKRNYHLHIALAPTKNIDRFEWFVEKCTEIGIDEITPIICEHSERKILKIDRIQRVIVAAVKQSIKAYIPTFNPPLSFAEFIEKESVSSHKFIAHCYEGKKELLVDSCKPGDSVLIMIGPEGDFTSEEVNFAISEGFSGLSLGNSRLRTETAGVVACHSVYFMNQKS